MPQFLKPNSINEIWASSGIISAPANLKISQGWTVEIPPYQFFNWSQNRTDRFMAHVNQHGIGVWDNTTEYQANRSYVQGSDGIVYRAKLTNTNVDPVSPLNRATWDVAFEPFGGVAVVQNQLNTFQTNYNTLANIANYPQARQNLSVWSRVESDARFAFKAGASTQTFSVANATESSHAVPLGQISSLVQQASTTVIGTARIATATEVEQGILDNVIVTPVTGNAYLKKSQNLADVPNKAIARTNLGITDVATRNETYFVRSLDLVAQIATFARIDAPAGWLVCDGRAVSRATYSDLFDAIGTLYGAGDGSTTFNLPDCRNEFMRGWNGNSGSVGNKAAQSIQSHSHTASSNSSGTHNHLVSIANSGAHSHGASTDSSGTHQHATSWGEFTTAWAKYGVNGGSRGNIGSAATDADNYEYMTSNNGNHTHNVNVSSAGAHTHNAQAEDSGSHTHQIVVEPTGGAETAPRHIRFLVCIRF